MQVKRCQIDFEGSSCKLNLDVWHYLNNKNESVALFVVLLYVFAQSHSSGI